MIIAVIPRFAACFSLSTLKQHPGIIATTAETRSNESQVQFNYFFPFAGIRVGDSTTTFSSGASPGNVAIFPAYQLMRGFADKPWAKTLISIVGTDNHRYRLQPGDTRGIIECNE